MSAQRQKRQFDVGQLVRTISDPTVWRITGYVFAPEFNDWVYCGDNVIGPFTHSGELQCNIVHAQRASNVAISDHALVRYFERVLGVDCDAIRSAILSARIEACINTLGDGKYPITQGFRAVVKNNVVVTITPVK